MYRAYGCRIINAGKDNEDYLFDVFVGEDTDRKTLEAKVKELVICDHNGSKIIEWDDPLNCRQQRDYERYMYALTKDNNTSNHYFDDFIIMVEIRKE